MVIKVWRALWKRMAGMQYCVLGADPAKTFAEHAAQTARPNVVPPGSSPACADGMAP